jgi:hypothetical protein
MQQRVMEIDQNKQASEHNSSDDQSDSYRNPTSSPSPKITEAHSGTETADKRSKFDPATGSCAPLLNVALGSDNKSDNPQPHWLRQVHVD